MKVAVVGTGYVGLVTAVCLSCLGHTLVGIDNDAGKLAMLKRGRSPVHEPGLEEQMARAMASGLLHFSDDLATAVQQSDIVFIAVGTPPLPSGASDTRAVAAVAEAIGAALATGPAAAAPAGSRPRLVVNKSTVPVGTGRWVQGLVQQGAMAAGASHAPAVQVVSNPEFLREGAALWDTFNPARIVLGADDPGALAPMEALYAPLIERRHSCCEGTRPVPVLKTDLASAELIKYAANAFLAARISFINEIASLCDVVGADVLQVADGIGMDQRIGRAFLDAGIGWGGSCLPKDVAALIHTAAGHGLDTPLLAAVSTINKRQRLLVVSKLQQWLSPLAGTTVGLLGLTFKPGTDDLRDAPSLDLADALSCRGVRVKGYDPYWSTRWSRDGIWPEPLAAVQPCGSAVSLAEGCDALVVVTEWPAFRTLDWEDLGQRMRCRLLMDGRNCLDGAVLTRAGFRWEGIGRGPAHNPESSDVSPSS